MAGLRTRVKKYADIVPAFEALARRREALAQGLLPQILQIDAKAAAIGKLIEGFAIAAEVGVNLEAMADIAHDEEGRRLMGLRQQPRIALALRAGVVHENVPGGVDGPAAQFFGLPGEEVRLPRDLLGAALDLAGLLGLQHEAIALVQINAPGRDGAIAGDLLHRALEDIIILPGMACGIGPGQAQHIAELAQEHGVIGPLLPPMPPLPPPDELLDGGRSGG